MTDEEIRIQFTKAAMQGLLAGHYRYYNGNDDCPVPASIAKEAVEIATVTVNLMYEKFPNTKP